MPSGDKYILISCIRSESTCIALQNKNQNWKHSSLPRYPQRSIKNFVTVTYWKQNRMLCCKTTRAHFQKHDIQYIMNKMWLCTSEGAWKSRYSNFCFFQFSSFKEQSSWHQKILMKAAENVRNSALQCDICDIFHILWIPVMMLKTRYNRQVRASPTYPPVCMRRMWYSVPAASSCGVDSTASRWSPSAPTTQPRLVPRWKPAAGRRLWSALICWGCRLSSQGSRSCPSRLKEKQESFRPPRLGAFRLRNDNLATVLRKQFDILQNALVRFLAGS